MEKAERIDKVEQTVGEVIGDYERLLKGLEKGKGMVEGGEGSGSASGEGKGRGKRKLVIDDDEDEDEVGDGTQERGAKRR